MTALVATLRKEAHRSKHMIRSRNSEYSDYFHLVGGCHGVQCERCDINKADPPEH